MAKQLDSSPVPACSTANGLDDAGCPGERELEAGGTPASKPAQPTPRIIALLSQKGGSGKTTTAVNLAAALVRAGHSSLVIDVDPQRAAGHCLGVSLTSSAASTHQVLRGNKTLGEIIVHTKSGVDIAPSHPDLTALAFDTSVTQEARLKLAIESLLQESGRVPYPFILIDCPPGLDVLSANALIAATRVVIPVEPEPLSLYTLPDMLRFINDVRLVNPRLQVMGFVLNKVSGQRQAQIKQTLRMLGKLHHEILGQVHDSAYVARAPGTGRTIFEVAPTCAAADDYHRLMEIVSNGRK